MPVAVKGVGAYTCLETTRLVGRGEVIECAPNPPHTLWTSAHHQDTHTRDALTIVLPQVLLAKTVLAGWVQRKVLPKLPNGQVLERMIKNQGFFAICIFR
jgi:hypothetical protein